MREPAYADLGAPPPPAAVVEPRKPAANPVIDVELAEADALARRAVLVQAAVQASTPAPASVAPLSPPTTTASAVQVVAPRPAAAVPPATTLEGSAADIQTLAGSAPVTSSVPPVTTPLTDPATSSTRSKSGTNPPVTPIEPSPLLVVSDRRAPVADVPATGAALLIPVVPSASPETKSAAVPTSLTAAAPNPPGVVSQCNGTDNVGGQAVACEVTITNELNMATGESSSVVEVEECHGAANTVLTCVNSVTPSDELTTSVDQCNGSGSGGGGTVECHVHIVNNITGPAAPTPATINQCNGSGAGGGTLPTVMCDPIGNTTDATITQCNDSGNGGGATMRVQCTVTPSTETSALPVDVDQCNGSGNGGGATVTCTVSVTNNIITEPPVVVPPPVVPPVVEPPVVVPPVVVPPVVEPPVVVPPPVVPPVVEPPVVVPPPVVPPVVEPPVVVPPPVVPPVVEPPVVVPPPVVPPVVEPPVVVPVLLTTELVEPPATPVLPVQVTLPSAPPVSTPTVTPVLTTAFTPTRQTLTPPADGSQPTAATVPTPAPVTSTTPVAASTPAASLSAQLAPTETQRPAARLALTGFDSRWLLLLAALAMAIGMLAVRLAPSATALLPVNERNSR